MPPVGRQIGKEELKTIEIGSTTKAEVTNLLGKPDLLENERFYVYEAGQNSGYIVVFIDPGGIGSLSEERYRLLFEFNVNEVVKRYHIEPIYLANWAGISEGWENPDNQTTSGKEALFQKTNFKELILLERGFFWRVAFSPDSKTVAARDNQKRLWLKDLDTGEQYFLDKQRVFDFQYSPDGKSLAMIDKKGFVRILDINSWNEIVVFRGHGEVSRWRSGGTERLSYSPDGRMVATSGNKELKIWNPLTGVEIMTIDVPKYVTSIAFSPDGKLIAAVTGTLVTGTMGTVNIWDAVDGSHLGVLDSKREHHINIEFSPKGRTLAVNKGTHLELWDVSQCEADRSSSDSSQIGELLDVFILPSGKRVGESRQSFSSDGNIIAVSNGRNIVIWDIAQSSEIRRFISTKVEDYPYGLFHDVAFSPDGNYLVIITGGGVYLCTVQSLYD
ncbi:MAG: hypothetical protein PVG96_03100 [Desulfobacterales bacterium]